MVLPGVAAGQAPSPVQLKVPARGADEKGTLLFDFGQERSGPERTVTLQATPALRGKPEKYVVARLERDLEDATTGKFIPIARVGGTLANVDGDLRVVTRIDFSGLPAGRFTGSVTIKSPPRARVPVQAVSIPIEVVLKGTIRSALLWALAGVVVGILAKGAEEAGAARKTNEARGRAMSSQSGERARLAAGGRSRAGWVVRSYRKAYAPTASSPARSSLLNVDPWRCGPPPLRWTRRGLRF